MSAPKTTTLPPLYAIVDVETTTRPDEYASRLIDAGIELVQLRSKRLLFEELCRLAERVLQARDSSGRHVQIIINDSVEACLKVGADGVHLGQEDASPVTAREVLGADRVIGLSTHTVEQIRSAPYESLSYIALGPIFQSKTKSGHAPIVGLPTLTEAARLCPLEVVAIGGISAENAASVYQAGAQSVAVIADLQRASDLASRIRKYYESSRRTV
ncbi:MAG: thiamine phosphate synthase [Bdellovibrionota bacterium]